MTAWREKSRETKRAMVFPWHCDVSGEMNPRFYFDHFDDSSFLVWSVIGCPNEFVREFGVTTVIASYSLEYIATLKAGASIVVHAGVTRLGDRSLAITHRMTDIASGEICATMVSIQVVFDLKSRKATSMPDPVRQRLLDSLIEEPGSAAATPPPNKPSPPPDAEWHDVHRSLVHRWHCDHVGHMNARWYAHHCDDGRRHLYAMNGVHHSQMEHRGISIATTNLEINYHREMQAGDLFVIRSRFCDLGESRVGHVHRLYNMATDEIHASMEGVDAFSEIQTGKAVEIPGDIRRMLS